MCSVSHQGTKRILLSSNTIVSSSISNISLCITTTTTKHKVESEKVLLHFSHRILLSILVFYRNNCTIEAEKRSQRLFKVLYCYIQKQQKQSERLPIIPTLLGFGLLVHGNVLYSHRFIYRKWDFSPTSLERNQS